MSSLLITPMIHYLKIFGLTLLLFTFSFSYAGEKIIVIDLGHGGKDNGVEVEGVFEKDLVLEIAQKIQALTTNAEFKIILTRESDVSLSLKDRVDYIKSLNPDFVISLHINADPNTRVNGFDLFVSPQNTKNLESLELAERIETSLSKEFTSNGIKESNFYILKNVNTASVTLELGYLSNPGNRYLLTSEYGQHRIAEAIYNVLK